MNEQLGAGAPDLDEFYGEGAWQRMVAEQKVIAADATPRGPHYPPEVLASLMAGAVLHPLDLGIQHSRVELAA